MKKFKIIISCSKINLASTYIDSICDKVQSYFNDNSYNVDIVENKLDDTSYSSAANLMKLEPDISIFINDGDWNGIFYKDNLSSSNKVFTDTFMKYLNKYNNNNTNDYKIIKQNIPIARTYPFISVCIKTIGENNVDYISKAIYKSVIGYLKTDQTNQEFMYNTTANINLKQSLEKNSIVLTKIPKGSKVKVLEKTNNIYWKVEYISPKQEKYIGYAAQTYIVL